MKVLLTGNVGVGKTCVCKKILSKVVGFSCCGILTLRVKEPRNNFKLVVKDLSNEKYCVFAYQKPINNPKFQVGIPFCNFIFTKKGIVFAKRAVEKTGDLLIIDEVGPLEMADQGINNAIAAFTSKKNKNAILVVRKKLEEEVFNMLDCKVEILEVTKKNRDELPEIIISKMV